MQRVRYIAARVAASGIALAAGTALAQGLAPITAGAPPQTLQVPAAPNASFTLAQAAEVQIDVMGAPMDAQAYLFSNGELVVQDSDSGEGVDARIVTFLAPGSYEVRVAEWRGRPMSARVQAAELPPMTPVATIAPGAPPTVVNAPAGDSARAASVELALTISAAGNYQIDATDPNGQLDPELQIIQNNALVAADSDSGGNRAARITRQLAPGEYRLRVRDWVNRAAAITVTVNQAP